MVNKMKPLLVKPIHDYTIWGSNHISNARGVEGNFGTWWEISAHPYCTNEIINLDKKTTLQEVIDENMEDILGPGLTLKQSLRLAYLDTQDKLSIQVHPFQSYAEKFENDNGKHESWYILDAAPGAKLCAGTLTNDAEIIKKAVKDGTLEQYINYVPVKKGDYIIIPEGMLHALGKDILAIEVGTNSNVTYRFYDYNRKDVNGKGRPLHLEKSFDVCNFNLQPTFVPAENKTRTIGDTPYYTVDEVFACEDTSIEVKDSYFILSNMGEDTKIYWEDEEIVLPKYDSVFVPYSAKKVILANGGHVLYSRPKKG